MANLSEKVNFLRRQFLEMDINHDKLLSKEELYNFLDDKSGQIFDRDVADELFDRMDKDHNNKVTADEYIKIFIQAEEVLNSKIEKISLNLNEYITEKDRLSHDYGDIVQIEKLNEYGVMFGSVLDVLIVNATDLRLNNANQYNIMSYCLLSCASRKFQTKLTDINNPVWNESFSFPIYDGNEHLQILIKDNIQNNFEFLGEIILPIQQFSNQKKNDLILDIMDREGNTGLGKIHIIAQWIYSKSKYLKENLDFIEKEISLLTETKRDYEESLRTLYLPFQGLMKEIEYYPIERLEQTKNQSVYLSKSTYQAPDFWFLFKSNKILFLTVFFEFLTFWICYNRAMFLDLVLYNLYISFHLLKKMNQKALRTIIVGLVISLLFDMSWMIVFSEHYWEPTSTSLMTSIYEQQLNRFVVVMSYIIFILKIILALVYFNESISPEMRVFS